MKKTLFDLFCGGGGFSVGAENANVFDEFYGFDCCEKCLGVYKLNLPNSNVTQMVLGSEMSKTIIIQKVLSCKNVHVHVHASPPCQDLSQLNKDRPNGDAVKLLEWSIGLIKDLLKLDTKQITYSLEEVSTKLVDDTIHKNLGENMHFRRIKYVEHGVPQLGRLRNIISSNKALELLESRVEPPTTPFRLFMENGLAIKNTHIKSYTTNTPVAACEANGFSTYRRLSAPETVRNIHQPTYAVLASNALSWANASGESGGVLSVEHHAALQTFPSSYIFPDGTSVKLKRRIVGNAVPPFLAKKIVLCNL